MRWSGGRVTGLVLTGLPTTGHVEARAIDQDGTVLVEHLPNRGSSLPTALFPWQAGTARRLANPSGTTTVHGWDLPNGWVAGSAYLHSVNRSGQSVGWSLSADVGRWG